MAYKEYPAKNRAMTQTFRGINRHEHIGDGEWFDLLNLTCDEYPAAKTREHRALVRGYQTTTRQIIGMYMEQGSDVFNGFFLEYVEGETVLPAMPFDATVYIGDRVIENTIIRKMDNPFSENQIILILKTPIVPEQVGPDPLLQVKYKDYKTPMLPGRPVDALVIDAQLIVATENGYLCGNNVLDVGAGLKQAVSYGRNIYTNNGVLTDETLGTATKTLASIGGGCNMILCNADGAEIEYVTTKPTNPQNGDYYYDESTKGLYQWSDAQEQWVPIVQNYIRLQFAAGDDLDGIKAGDAVKGEIKGDYAIEVEGVQATETRTVSSAWTVHSVSEGSQSAGPVIVLNGLIDPTGTNYNASLRRRMPVFDFVCEHNNRIFGCRYGLNDEGEFVNEVYASALGDPLNWFLFEGTSHDSYTTSVGAPGPWTGCCECGEYVLFFKADKIFVMSGGVPSAFRLVPFDDFGVQAGSERSLAVIGNVAYYKSTHGVRRISPFAYPNVISEGLGYDKWTQAVGGSDGRKYYVSMAADGERSTFVYDTWTGLWTRENEAVSAIACTVRYKTNLLVIGGVVNSTKIGALVKYDEEKSADYKSSHTFKSWIQAVGKTTGYFALSLRKLAQELNVQTVDALRNKIDNDDEIFLKVIDDYAYNAEYVYVSNEKPADLEPITSTYSFDDFVVTGTALEEELVNEPDFAWFAESGNLGLEEPDEKRIRVLQIRAKSGQEASLHVQAMFDGANAGEMLRCENRGKTGTYRVAFTPARRCDTYKLRLSGTGDTVIYSITTETEDAGDYVR